MPFLQRLSPPHLLDLRSLALYRIALGLVLLWDTVDRARDLTAHYTDAGVYPAEMAVQLYGHSVYASPHILASGSPLAEAAVFAVSGACAIGLMLGWHTRLMTVLCWFLFASVQIRVQIFAGLGGDIFNRVLLAFAFFMPLHARFSLDARRAKQPPPDAHGYASLATFGFLFQICLMYLATGFLKTGDLWSNGNAVFFALSQAQNATPLTPWLLEQRWLLPPLTYMTLFLERFGWWPLLVPFAVPWIRAVAVPVFVVFHLSLALFLNIGLFPVFCMVAWLALIPAAFWDSLLPRFGIGHDWASARGERRATDVRPLPGLFKPVVVSMSLFGLLYQVTALGWVDWGHGRELPPVLRRAGQVTRMNQTFSMMSPNPGNVVFWISVDGRLASGDHYDPFLDAPFSLERPADIVDSMRTHRWRLYLMSAFQLGHQPKMERRVLGAFADHLCNDWNDRHPPEERMEHVALYRTTALITESGLRPPVPDRKYSQLCESR